MTVDFFGIDDVDLVEREDLLFGDDDEERLDDAERLDERELDELREPPF